MNGKIFIVLFLFFANLLIASEKIISVTVQGEGETRTKALEDAFRNAVRKVVGAYVVTQTEIKDDVFDENIYINADAIVTHHKVLSEKIENGLTVVRIEARVVKNELQKYITKEESSKITSTDIGNILNRRRAIAIAEKSLDYIFESYTKHMYLGKKIGDYYVPEDDDVENFHVKMGIPYEISFNVQEYANLSKRLQNLLSKVSLAHNHGVNNSYEYLANRYSGYLIKLMSGEIVESWPKNGSNIILLDRLYEGGEAKYRYNCYAVPKQIYEKIKNLLSSSSYGVIVFEFNLKGRDKPLIKCLKADLSFFEYYGGAILLRNWMGISVAGGREFYTRKKDFKSEFTFTEDQIRALTSCTIKIYSGDHGRYVYNSSVENKWGMAELANDGYIPAMIAMVEQFNSYNEWYHRAALLGSRHAQKNLGWKNSGLGFEIDFSNGRTPVVCSSRKGVNAKKGMIIKSINGMSVDSIEEISKLIGALPVGSSVKIYFDHGKAIDFKTLP